MKLSEAQQIINEVHTLDYSAMILHYRKWELLLAVRTIDNRKNSTDDDKKRADIVYWKIALYS